MILSLDVIDRLPREMAAVLEADEFFADVPVIVAEDGDVAAEIARKQAVVTAKSGKRGAAVIVLQVVCDDEYPEVKFGPLTLRPAFQVVENLELNRGVNGTGKSARRIARRVQQVIKATRLDGLTTDFLPDKPCIEPVQLGDQLGKLIRAYQVNFRTFEADTEQIQQAASVAFGRTETTPEAVTLSCATAGAQIWYTLDDTFPAPPAAVSGSTALLYAEPIVPSDATLTIRACAYVAGMIASQVARAEIIPS